jgi:hypothetical protein
VSTFTPIKRWSRDWWRRQIHPAGIFVDLFWVLAVLLAIPFWMAGSFLRGDYGAISCEWSPEISKENPTAVD